MNRETLPNPWSVWRAGLPALCLLLGPGILAGALPSQAQEVTRWWDPGDPRIGLEAGWMDAGETSWNMELVANEPRPDGFVDPENPGAFAVAASDLAFQGNLVFVGNFNGINIYDVSDPASPRLRGSIVCPGGQGDVSVYGNLLFMSVEETRGRIDCGIEGTGEQVDPERFRGVRVFDISDLAAPRQVAAVQTCRGSHTHTLLQNRTDPDHVYVYVSGAAGVRPAEELAGCVFGEGVDPDETALFRIEVIRVPVARPRDSEVVSMPRVFADRETGDVAGLWPGGAHGEGTQRSAQTNHCHDITVYEELGLAAGACSGNGILLDIRDPVNPVRVDEVIDENFAYWHSATFNNDGTTVIFTDEWGGGTSPRCRATDHPEWGANAIFRMSDTTLYLGGHWSAYWYNGHVYASEIARGLDVLRLTPGEHLSQNELEAALLVRWDELNPQDQPRMTWPAAFPVARAYVDQLERSGAMARGRSAELRNTMDRAERARTAGERRQSAEDLEGQLAELRIVARWAGTATDGDRLRALVETLRELASSLR